MDNIWFLSRVFYVAGTVESALHQLDIIWFNSCSLPMSCRFQFYFCFTDEEASVLQMKFSKAVEFISGGGGMLT